MLFFKNKMQSMQMIKLVLGANKTITLTFQERCCYYILYILIFSFLYQKKSNKQQIFNVIQWICNEKEEKKNNN